MISPSGGRRSVTTTTRSPARTRPRRLIRLNVRRTFSCNASSAGQQDSIRWIRAGLQDSMLAREGIVLGGLSSASGTLVVTGGRYKGGQPEQKHAHKRYSQAGRSEPGVLLQAQGTNQAR